ncbi:hypothetical protein ARMGADRAFT_1038398 [Armillaria gallica]|uniref:Uncharacterized protein n=1 Tax=Armillaria gallica TaxID=47427 RepID=A0A2H3CI02_ARMGA|nr:hypothetical protein ARMGADRAFT_1038398 [Armillaria gallica]
MEVGQDIYHLIGDGPHQNTEINNFAVYPQQQIEVLYSIQKNPGTGSWTVESNNHPPNCKNANTLEHLPSDPPVFPDFDDAMLAEELRKIVKEFVELQWGAYIHYSLEQNQGELNLSKGNIIDLADYLKDCTVTLFLPQSKPNLPKKLSLLTKPSTKDLLNASVETLWQKVAGQMPALSGHRPSPVPSSKGMAEGNDNDEGETDTQDGGAGIVDFVSPSEDDDHIKDDDEKQKNANGSSANGSTSADGVGNDGMGQDQGLEDGDILDPENGGDNNEESLDTNASSSGGIPQGGRGGRATTGASTTLQWKKSERQEHRTQRRDEIEYKPYPRYKGYFLPVTPKKRNNAMGLEQEYYNDVARKIFGHWNNELEHRVGMYWNTIYTLNIGAKLKNFLASYGRGIDKWPGFEWQSDIGEVII